MKKAFQAVDKAVVLKKETQKEVQKEMQMVETKDSKTDNKFKQTAVVKKPTSSKAKGNKPMVKAKSTPKPRASIRESVKKATDKAVTRLASEVQDDAVKVKDSASKMPWESTNTQVAMSSPKLTETTNFKSEVTNPAYVKQEDSNQKNTGTPSKVTNYSGFGTVGMGFSKN